eukprot:29402-Chlamydomonas_euryale.AAC.1
MEEGGSSIPFLTEAAPQSREVVDGSWGGNSHASFGWLLRRRHCLGGHVRAGTACCIVHRVVMDQGLPAVKQLPQEGGHRGDKSGLRRGGRTGPSRPSLHTH